MSVNGAWVGRIGPGLCVFLGVGRGDGPAEVPWMAEKLATLRIFEDAAGKMNLGLLDTHRAALVVSQFTLYADARTGRRPSFLEAAGPAQARPLYEAVCTALAERGIAVSRGVFGAEMQVALVNDGPVTIWIDSAD